MRDEPPNEGMKLSERGALGGSWPRQVGVMESRSAAYAQCSADYRRGEAMRLKGFLVAWAAYVIVTFAAGFIWHLLLFKQLYRDLGIFSRIDDPIIPLGLTAMLIQGAVLAYLYPRLLRHRHPIADGLKFGVLMGVLMLSSAVIAEAAKQRVASLPTWLIVESVYYLLQFGVSGLCIGLAYGRVHDAAEQGVEADEA